MGISRGGVSPGPSLQQLRDELEVLEKRLDERMTSLVQNGNQTILDAVRKLAETTADERYGSEFGRADPLPTW